MSLTIPHQPYKPDFEARHTTYTNDSSPRYLSANPRLPSPYRADSPLGHVRVSDILSSTLSSSAVRALSAFAERNKMTTPSRGLAPLPPPSAMTLPDPRPNHPSAGPQPAPPSHSYSNHQEESSRSWYSFKAEEERRKQEEERTRQETLKLEQRKVEASMLHDALQAGVPPGLVPMLYIGLGRDASSLGQEWMQQLAAQFQSLAAAHQSQQHEQQLQLQNHPHQHAQQQRHHIGSSPPEARREVRGGAPVPPSYHFTLPSQGQILASQPADPAIDPQHHRIGHCEQSLHRQQPQASGPLQTTFSAYEPDSRHSTMPHARSATHSQLPQLATNDGFVLSNQRQHQSGTAISQHGTHHVNQPRPESVQAATSPNLLFHHWVPPNEAKAQQSSQTSRGNTSAGAAGDDNPPNSARASEAEQREITPRKRKAEGAHQANPPPSSVGDRGARSPSYSAMSATSATAPMNKRRHGNGGRGSIHSVESMGETSSTKAVPIPTSAPSQSGRFRSSGSSDKSSFRSNYDEVTGDRRHELPQSTAHGSRNREPAPSRGNDDRDGEWLDRQQQRQHRYEGLDRHRRQLSGPRSRSR